MFSPGKYHERVPKDPRRNLAFRRWVLNKAAADEGYKKSLIEACRNDILFYINTFVWQHNPKKRGCEVGPFITWGFQDAALCSRDAAKPGMLWCIENDHDLLIEKSRDMGASWLCLLAFEWLWHFHRDKNFIIISRNEDAVDKPGTPSCLFWKLDHIHKHLPPWLMPEGWGPGGVRNKFRTDLQFINPETRSVITGEASTGKAGVGGRATAMFIDEFSQIREDREVLQRTADTTNCRIFNGTHIGLGTAFYRLSIKPGIKKIVMHWTDHPEKGAGAYHYNPEKAEIVPHDTQYQYPPDFVFRKDGKPSGGPFVGVCSPWYDKECKRRASERDVAMDLDIDCRGSVRTFFDALEMNQLKVAYCCDPYWRGDLHYDRERAQPHELVTLKDGPLKLWMNPTPHMAIVPGKYAAGADISMGMGATPSCFTAIDANTGIKVLEYTNAFLKPEEFAVLCVALCRLLKDGSGEGAMFGWEAAGGAGKSFGKTVIDLGYRKIYYRTDEFDTDADPTSKPGWYPQPDLKMHLLSEYRSALINHEMENRSAQSLDETLLFKYDNRGRIVHQEEASVDDPSGAGSNHADRVIADALAWKMVGEVGGRTVREPEEEQAPIGSLQWRRDVHDTKAKKAKAWI